MQVKDCFDYLVSNGDSNISVYGSSMGAVAIMKALADYRLNVSCAIVESPFASMYQTVGIRFRNFHIPQFPMAHLMLFWGGVENGFWAFGHRPVDYATHVKCPILLQYGAKDDRVAGWETDSIYAHLQCTKQLIVYSMAGHDDMPALYHDEWAKNVTSFLEAHKK